MNKTMKNLLCILTLLISTISFSQTKMTVIATAYGTGKSENGGHTRTATGHKLGFGIIAVDPKVIKLGSKIVVPGYGVGYARDVGGAIKGRRIDVCLPSRWSVNRWGRKKITILVYPPVVKSKKKK